MLQLAKNLKGDAVMTASTVMYNMISAQQHVEVTVDSPGLYCRTHFHRQLIRELSFGL